MRDASPLRYPGGKWRIAGFFEQLIQINRLSKPAYVEPYAGGASLALSLLFKERVSEIYLNDIDPAIYAFWYSILNYSGDFLQILNQTKITPDEWAKQKEIYGKGSGADRFALGFATFFLNRTNHSGILNGGMIGGRQQLGQWKLDARFNKPELMRRIERIGSYKDRIHISCEDAMDFLRNNRFFKKHLLYLDPPYYKAGRYLYFNSYKESDHAIIKDNILRLKAPWVVSYDDVPEIRRLYRGIKSQRLQLLHTARSLRMGNELLFFAPNLRAPAFL